MDDDAFLAAIYASPRDDTMRLVYADWLEERGDVRGEWIRVSVRLQHLLWHRAPEELPAKQRWVREVAALKRQLRDLRLVVEEAWALRIQQGHIEQCNLVGIGVKCPRDWMLLEESTEPVWRTCGHCKRRVRYCWMASEVHAALVDRHPIVKALAMKRTE